MPQLDWSVLSVTSFWLGGSLLISYVLLVAFLLPYTVFTYHARKSFLSQINLSAWKVLYQANHLQLALHSLSHIHQIERFLLLPCFIKKRFWLEQTLTEPSARIHRQIAVTAASAFFSAWRARYQNLAPLQKRSFFLP